MPRLVTPPDPGPLPPLHYAPPPGPLRVLFRDAQWLAVEKPAGLLSVPGKGDGMADCVEARAQAVAPGARIVHRLDLDTSGVMILALTAAAHRHLGLQFERRHARKVYEARVAGRMAASVGRLSLPLRCDWPNRPRQIPDCIQGRRAVTAWEVMWREPGATRVRLRPLTGRSHQLRVHMLALGHPILGDPLYAPDTAGEYDRMMLHSEELRLKHPESGKAMKFRAKPDY